MRLQESIQIFKSRWMIISTRQKIGVVTLIFLLLALPLSVGSVLIKQFVGSRASITSRSPITPPITPPFPTPTVTPTMIPSPTPTPTPPAENLPDLAIVNQIIVSPNPVPAYNDTLISFEIVNIGKSVAVPAQYTITDKAGGKYRVNPTNTCNSYTSLKPGEKCIAANLFTFSQIGDKTIVVVLDYGDIIKESNELNNKYLIPVKVTTNKPVQTLMPKQESPIPIYASSVPIPTLKPVIQTTSVSTPVCRFKIFGICLIR